MNPLQNVPGTWKEKVLQCKEIKKDIGTAHAIAGIEDVCILGTTNANLVFINKKTSKVQHTISLQSYNINISKTFRITYLAVYIVSEILILIVGGLIDESIVNHKQADTIIILYLNIKNYMVYTKPIVYNYFIKNNSYITCIDINTIADIIYLYIGNTYSTIEKYIIKNDNIYLCDSITKCCSTSILKVYTSHNIVLALSSKKLFTTVSCDTKSISDELIVTPTFIPKCLCFHPHFQDMYIIAASDNPIQFHIIDLINNTILYTYKPVTLPSFFILIYTKSICIGIPKEYLPCHVYDDEIPTTLDILKYSKIIDIFTIYDLDIVVCIIYYTLNDNTIISILLFIHPITIEIFTWTWFLYKIIHYYILFDSIYIVLSNNNFIYITFNDILVAINTFISLSSPVTVYPLQKNIMSIKDSIHIEYSYILYYILHLLHSVNTIPQEVIQKIFPFIVQWSQKNFDDDNNNNTIMNIPYLFEYILFKYNNTKNNIYKSCKCHGCKLSLCLYQCISLRNFKNIYKDTNESITIQYISFNKINE